MDSLTALLNASLARRKMVAVVFALLSTALIAVAILSAVTTLKDQAESLEAKRQQLGRFMAIRTLKPILTREQQLENAKSERPEFLAGESEAVIQANLQTRLTAMAATNQSVLISVGNTPIAERDGTRYAGIRANITGTNEAIVDTLYAIETTTPFLTVRSARLNPVDSGANAAAQQNAPELFLQVQFEGALLPVIAASANGKATK